MRQIAMVHSVVNVETEHEQIAAFLEFAEMYKADFFKSPLKHFLTQDLEKTFDFILSRYRVLPYEMNFRPLNYIEVFSDCDAGMIFMISLLRAANVPRSAIYICEAKESDDDYFTHIFCALKLGDEMIYLDNLPGSVYGSVNYAKSNMRKRPMTEFL